MPSGKVGFIGLGEMGLPMAINLQKAGYQVYAYEVNTVRYLEAERHGVLRCDSPCIVASNVDEAIISIVRDFKQTEDVLFSTNGIFASKRNGLLIIVMSTLDPVSMGALEAKVTQSGNYLIDAPVSGAKSGAEAGTLTIMTAGEKEAVTKCEGYFKAMGKNIFYFGPQPGAGQAAKLANNLILAINMVAFTEGMRFAKEYNLPSETFRDLITVSTGNSWVGQNWNEVKLWWEKYKPNTTLDIVYKDLFAIMKVCAENHFSLPLGGLTFHLLMDAWKRGKTDMDGASKEQ